MSSKILVIDDDVAFCMMMKTFLTKKGYDVFNAFTSAEAEELISSTPFDLVLTDVRLPDSDGVTLLEQIKNKNTQTQVVLMTGYTDIKTAVNVMKLGAFDYIAKPINSDEMLHTIEEALKNKNVSKREVATKGAEITHQNNLSTEKNLSDDEYIKGQSEKSIELHHYIDVVAPTNISVLIIGDSGTGKENIAYSIHNKSKRSTHPYIAVDCGAIPKDLAASEFFGHVKGSFTGATSDKIGHFEAANGGTLFLDEVGNLTYEVQVQLLRALQERKVKPVGSSKEIDVDIRVIAATNEDLQKAVREGNFREDLYHRLNEFSIAAPKLSERGNDILNFAYFFLNKSNEDLDKKIEDFSNEVKDIFLRYDWPGNLREMRNVIKRAVLLTNSSIIEKNVLPSEITHQKMEGEREEILMDVKTEADLKLFSSKNEETTIRLALEKAKYNKTKAAQILGIDRKTLYNKIKLYEIEL